jgi:hypothetical protein
VSGRDSRDSAGIVRLDKGKLVKGAVFMLL